MDWQPWVDEGVLGSAPIGRARLEPMIRRAWARVGESSRAYQVGRWETADEKLREAFSTAGHAIVCAQNLDPYGECDFELAEEFAVHAYGERFVRPLFDRARRLREMLPLDREISEETDKLIRNSIASSSAFVAYVESATFRDHSKSLLPARSRNCYIRRT